MSRDRTEQTLHVRRVERIERGPAEGHGPVDERALEAERRLARSGIDGARVEVAGHEREIATVHAPHRYAARLAELAPEIKALGFRYVALDLNTDEAAT